MVTALSPVEEPYNTADMLRDNMGPYRVISPTGPLLGRNQEPITTHKVRRKSMVQPKETAADDVDNERAPLLSENPANC
jgi:hypothetical protein